MILKFWKMYNIERCLENIKLSWKEIKALMMHHVWKRLWSQCIQEESQYYLTDIEDLPHGTAALAQQACGDIDKNNIHELLGPHGQENSAQDLLQQTAQ